MVYDVDGIKQRNAIADVVAAHGVVLRESGTHLVGLCPFHEDQHPSFAVYPETRSFYCFRLQRRRRRHRLRPPRSGL
jgi:DNA primase